MSFTTGIMSFVATILSFVNLQSSLLVATLTIVIVWRRRSRTQSSRGLGLPPSPFHWPILGCLPGLAWASLKSRMPPFQMFARKSCGKIFSLTLGNRHVIVLNGHEVIKEAFLNASLCGRPGFTEHGAGNTGLLFANGDVWKIQRRFTLMTFRNFGMGKTKFHEKITEETRHLVEEFEKHLKKPFDPAHVLNNAISNIVCSVIFGRRYEYSDQKFRRLLTLLDLQINSVGQTGFLIMVPIIRYFLFRGKDPMENSREELRSFVTDIIKDHKDNFDSDAVKDYIDVYLKERQDNSFNSSELNEESLLKTVVQLFIAGTETTVNTLRWSLLYMMKFPEVQVKVQQEIDSIVGAGRLPTMSDNLPYTEATLMEVQRIATIVPLGVPHCATEDTTIQGFQIPQGATVLSNLWAVHHDPDLWQDPEEFHPERFLDDNGQVTQPGFYIPFSTGRRMCIGENLARMEQLIIFTHLLQRFTISKPEDTPPLSFKGSMGATNSPQPYEISVTERK